MTFQQALAFALMSSTIACFIWGKLRYDLIALVALVVGAVVGIIPVDRMFSGFWNELIWIIGAALVLRAAIARSGLVERVLGPLLSGLGAPALVIPTFTGVVMLLSMVTKNVSALAIVMPVALRHARRTQTPASRLLMPMSFASLLGGLVTLVGTSPNIVVSSVRETLLGQPFGMFDYAPVGLGVCAVGFIFLSIAPRFIHVDRTPASGVDAGLGETRYVTELEVEEHSRCVGQTLGDLIAGTKSDILVRAVVTAAGRVGPDLAMTLRSGDHLIVEGDQQGLDRLAQERRLTILGERHRDQGEAGEDVRVIEGVVRQQSDLIGRSVAQARLHENYGLSLIAVAREGRRFEQELRSLKLKAGDLLILKADGELAGDAFAELQILPLTERGLALGQKRFGYGPAVALGCAVVSVALGAPIVLAFAAAVIAVLLSRVMSMGEAYRAIQGPMLVLLAALIPISESISRTGGDQLIATGLSYVLGPAPPFIAVGLLIVVGMAVTPFLNNAATVLIMAPIAAAVAAALQANPDPFLMAVAIGAACDFLTPIGHQCNTLVMGPGGYRFFDYWRLGLPLSALVVLTATPLILLVWPIAVG